LVSFVRPGSANADVSRPTAFIDANTGEVLFSYDNLQTNLIGTGPGGNAKTGQYEYGTDFGFNDVAVSGSTCTMNNANVKTINLNHGTSGTAAYSYDCPRNTVKSINGAYSPLNDAHYFGGVVFDMFDSYVGSPPLTFQLTMRVHYSNSYENAFWDGSAMTFGDGATTFYPLVSLDVSSHEVAHGFTEQNSALVYSGMSGGMNEAYSDMAGEAAEYYNSGNTTNDWMVGEQIFKSTGALRYMIDPTQDGRSIGHADDYSGQDVHYTSGVFNRAFYLLATTAGWDTKSAFQAMSLANQTYWTANSTFDEGGCGVYNAAGDLGLSQADVRTAFATVGVNTCDAPPPPPPGVLENGVSQTISGASGSNTYWSMETPADVGAVAFDMTGGSGDADMYVRFGSAPTSSTYDCRPYAAGNTENCSFATGQTGTYHVMVNGYSSYSGATLVGTYEGSEPPTGGDSGTKTGISLAAKAWDRTTIDIPAGASNFVVSTAGGTGNIKLYLREGANPTTKLYDCRSRTSGNDETCTIAAPAAGSWVIGIKANNTASTGVNMAWSYE
jgi:vibriolysin